jgi:hypothetical protein
VASWECLCTVKVSVLLLTVSSLSYVNVCESSCKLFKTNFGSICFISVRLTFLVISRQVLLGVESNEYYI